MKYRGLLLAVLSILILVTCCVSINGCGRGKKGTFKVAGIIFQEDQFFRLVLFGMRDAAKKNNVELLEGNSANKPDKEIQLVNTYIANEVNAIIVSPLSAKASVTALARAREKGITVITYNTNVVGDIPACFIQSDQFDLGASTGRFARGYIEKNFGGKAKVALIAFLSQVPEQSSARSSGFKSEVTKLPGVQIVAEQDAWLAEQAVKKVGDILTANPNVNIIWAANEGGTVGAVMAVKNAGKAGNVAVFGTDTGEQLADFLLEKDNILQAITGQRPYDIGSTALETTIKVLKGMPMVQKTISLSGQLLTREKPDEVKSFKEKLASMTK
ncbi:MAG: substrate-binding domain-containing protein [bacterium]